MHQRDILSSVIDKIKNLAKKEKKTFVKNLILDMKTPDGRGHDSSLGDHAPRKGFFRGPKTCR